MSLTMTLPKLLLYLDALDNKDGTLGGISIAAIKSAFEDQARYRWLKEQWSTGHGAHHVEWRFDIGCAEVYGLEPLIDKAMWKERAAK